MTTTIDTILLTSDATLGAPDVARLTTQSLDGTGVFDILMKTKGHESVILQVIIQNIRYIRANTGPLVTLINK